MNDVKTDLDRVGQVYQDRIRAGAFSRYSLTRPGEQYMHQRREAAILAALDGAGWRRLEPAHILEIGCGRGERLADLARWGALPEHIVGVDLLPALVREAAGRDPRFRLAAASAHQLPFSAESFDLVMQFTVFTSLKSRRLKQALASEMLRVLKPDGLILWYDLRYPSLMNRNLQAIRAPEIRRLFPGTQVRIQTLTLLPPLARALAPGAGWMCRWLEKIPVLRGHCLAIIAKAGRGVV
jgi:ubiquinone/menaquinone biosynthesis C-methylase UbiE